MTTPAVGPTGEAFEASLAGYKAHRHKNSFRRAVDATSARTTSTYLSNKRVALERNVSGIGKTGWCTFDGGPAAPARLA